MEFNNGEVKFRVPIDALDCEDFVRKVIVHAPDAIAMNKDARLVLNWKTGQKRLVGESLEAYEEILELGVSKTSKLGTALVDMYETTFHDQIEKLFQDEPISMELMLKSRVK